MRRPSCFRSRALAVGIALLAGLVSESASLPAAVAAAATVDSERLIYTVAGTGTNGFGGDGGPATQAQLNQPHGMAPGTSGVLFVADTTNNRVRKVDQSGTITTYAGTGTQGFSGDGGPATQAQLVLPRDVAVDAGGNVYVADSSNHRIRKIDTSGTITTVAGTGPSTTVGAYSGDGGPATQAHLHRPSGVDVDGAGNVYVADTGNNRIRRVDPLGVITTVGGTGVAAYGGDGGAATLASLNLPVGVDVDENGALWIADTANHRIRRVSPGGDGVVSGANDESITTVAGGGTGSLGDGGPAVSAQLRSPQGAAVDGGGTLYIADTGSERIRKVDTSGIITTIAGTGVRGLGGEGTPATQTQLAEPKGVASDAEGNVYFPEAVGGRVRVLGALFVSVADSPDPAFVGRPVNYTATVANGSPTAAASVVLTDVLPSELSFVSAESSQGTCSERRRTVTCMLGTLEAGAAATVTIAVVPKEVGTIANAVTFEAAHPDSVRRDNADTETTFVRPASVFLTNTDSPDPAQVDKGDITYRLLVENGLWDDATDVVLTDPLPAEVVFRSATASQGTCSQRRGTVTCRLGTVASGASATVDVVATPRTPGVVVNTASVKAKNFRTAVTGTAQTLVSAADCGMVVTANTTLQGDIGPCAYNGVIVRGDGITLNLGGHRVFRFSGAPATDANGILGNAAGIRLPMRTEVTVMNGTVTGFDAGIVVVGGGSHRITGIVTRDNIGADDRNSFLGDGIVLFNSANNRLEDNQVIHNGHFDGIGVLGPRSDGNILQGNVVEDNIGSGRDSNQQTGQGIMVNAWENFFDPLTFTPDQDRASDDGRVVANTVRRNGSAGISNVNTANSEVIGNVVEGNGVTNRGGVGIGASVVGNEDEVVSSLLIHGNEVHGNAEHGIQNFVGGGNEILHNDAADNAIRSAVYSDLRDEGRCIGSTWFGNTWGSGGYNDLCTTVGGTGPHPLPTDDSSSSSSQQVELVSYRQIPPMWLLLLE